MFGKHREQNLENLVEKTKLLAALELMMSNLDNISENYDCSDASKLEKAIERSLDQVNIAIEFLQKEISEDIESLETSCCAPEEDEEPEFDFDEDEEIVKPKKKKK